MKTLVVICILSLFSTVAFSQANDENASLYGWAWSWHTGPFLPNNIPGVTEIQPTTGLRLTFPTSAYSSTDYFFSSSNAEGVTYYNLAISKKAENDFDGMTTLAYLGLDAFSYKVGTGDFQTKGGGHFGIGLVSPLGGHTNFRMDMKFNFSDPGTALYLGFGLEMRYPPSGDDGEEEE